MGRKMLKLEQDSESDEDMNKTDYDHILGLDFISKSLINIQF